jgi:hypothetical protein
MLPVPEGVQVAPADEAQVHEAAVSAAGTVSAMVAPVTAEGPMFVATTVYVTDVPGTSVVEPSVLVT